MAGAQLLGIVGRPTDGDRPRMMKAVSDRRRAAADAADLQRDDLFAEHCYDALQRPHPAQGAAAPAHRPRPGEFGDDALHGFRDHLAGSAAGPLHARNKDAVTLLELLTRQARLAQEAFERLRWSGRARPFA